MVPVEGLEPETTEPTLLRRFLPEFAADRTRGCTSVALPSDDRPKRVYALCHDTKP